MKSLIKTGNVPALIPRLITGLIFLSEGLQKFITPDVTGAGRFAKIGFSDPVFWASITGWFEMICGVLILVGLFTRFAAVPLFVIMMTALIVTKIPILTEKGFWQFAHDYRTDFAMTLLLLFLLIYGGGNYSMDKKISSS